MASLVAGVYWSFPPQSSTSPSRLMLRRVSPGFPPEWYSRVRPKERWSFAQTANESASTSNSDSRYHLSLSRERDSTNSKPHQFKRNPPLPEQHQGPPARHQRLVRYVSIELRPEHKDGSWGTAHSRAQHLPAEQDILTGANVSTGVQDKLEVLCAQRCYSAGTSF